MARHEPSSELEWDALRKFVKTLKASELTYKDGHSHYVQSGKGFTHKVTQKTIGVKSTVQDSSSIQARMHVGMDLTFNVCENHWENASEERQFVLICHEAAHIKHYDGHSPDFWWKMAFILRTALENKDRIDEAFDKELDWETLRKRARGDAHGGMVRTRSQSVEEVRGKLEEAVEEARHEVEGISQAESSAVAADKEE